MRPFAYAALSLALAGCSLPYASTSFKAQPELEAALQGRGRKEEGEKRIGTGVMMYGNDRDDVLTTDTFPNGAMDRAGVAFPRTAQPASGEVATRLPAGETHTDFPSAQTHEVPPAPVPTTTTPDASASIPQPAGSPMPGGTPPEAPGSRATDPAAGVRTH